MKLDYASSFKKQMKKLPQNMRAKARARLSLFLSNQFHPLLNNHKLGGKYEGCRSVNITGSYRIIFCIKDDVCLLLQIGTHPELYGN